MFTSSFNLFPFDEIIVHKLICTLAYELRTFYFILFLQFY